MYVALHNRSIEEYFPGGAIPELRAQRGADLSGADLGKADLSEAFVGTSKAPGQLPDGFPKGWIAPPSGWELYDDNERAHLRRSSPSPQ
jgi:hypothetical protein